MRDGYEGLTFEQAQQMLNFFMYRVKPDQRRELAKALPQAYNAWHGRKIVKVIGTDGSEWE